MEWKYIKKVTDSLNPFSYVYSCITELSDGSIVDLYESDKAEFSLKGYTIDELKVNDKTKVEVNGPDATPPESKAIPEA